jgi:hypothetical protein
MATTTKKKNKKRPTDQAIKKTPKGVKVNYLTPKSGYKNSVSPKNTSQNFSSQFQNEKTTL